MMKKYLDHVFAGVGLMMIGTLLILDDRFFTWPPDTVKFANDNVWGSLFIIIGFGLLAWVIDGQESIKWNRHFLTAFSGVAFVYSNLRKISTYLYERK